jgi:L-amino acid N-acyltransferase YncA
MNIRPASQADAGAICAIYNPFISNTTITFEEAPVEAEEMERRIAEVSSSFPWLVFQEGGAVLGYAYASPWKSRSSYRYSVETTVYAALGHARKGIGSSLYGRLLPELRKLGCHCAVGGIALPNQASIAFHERFGFRKVAEFKEIGKKFNRWIDVGYWQLLL